MSEIVYGLDFGTSNSAITIYEQGGVRIINVENEGSKTLPSVIYFSSDDSCHVGQRAVDRYISEGMKGRFIQSIKTILPHTGFICTWIGFKKYELEDLVAIILRELKKIADNEVGENIDRVVLGRPAKFSEDSEEEGVAEQRLIKAAKRAGFRDIKLQLEPIAAALSYESGITKPELVLVIDIGGGTTDITIMRLDPTKVKSADRREDMLASAGVNIGGDKFSSFISEAKLFDYFGHGAEYWSGNMWMEVPRTSLAGIYHWEENAFIKADRKLMSHLDRACKLAKNIDRERIERLKIFIDENLGYQLFLAVDRAKCELSSRNTSEIRYFYPPRILVSEPIEREEFEALITDSAKKIESCIIGALKQAGLKVSDINTVFTTGGTSNIPYIIEMLKNKFGHCQVCGQDVFMSVAKGLALSARYLL